MGSFGPDHDPMQSLVPPTCSLFLVGCSGQTHYATRYGVHFPLVQYAVYG